VGAGSAEIDLRYLSSRRVLVLVDGLRWVPGAAASGVPGSVDLNTIPTAMITRTEVLQEGASPIYGSDAIAGVVNIITKDRLEGFQGNAQIGSRITATASCRTYNVSWGAATGGTAIVVGGGYFKQDPVSGRGPRDQPLPCAVRHLLPGGRLQLRHAARPAVIVTTRTPTATWTSH
jgi:iron complex outermembrane receptor protein